MHTEAPPAGPRGGSQPMYDNSGLKIRYHGVPVPSLPRHLAYADFSGDFPMGRQNFQGLPEAVQQVRCGECGSCAIQCPNGVRVQERMMRAQEMFGQERVPAQCWYAGVVSPRRPCDGCRLSRSSVSVSQSRWSKTSS